tara:strand:- start:188 stop:385 length:198 start_codon:yes stop_codon:yes gene_type:complete
MTKAKKITHWLMEKRVSSQMWIEYIRDGKDASLDDDVRKYIKKCERIYYLRTMNAHKKLKKLGAI